MLKHIAAALLGATLSLSALAQDTLSEGEVRRVDKSAGKITLKHGEIRNLDMPPMTMVFGVPDKALLEKVKAGDKVRFAADKDAAGNYVVTSIEAQK
ncbi:MAG: copper-binding protein [Comamonadaceae bacterium]|nr:MAG: copper-binding protein [Comamonadaceae bacterium]